MVCHALEVFLEFLQKIGGVQDEAEVFKVFVKGMGYGLAEVDAADCLGVGLLQLLAQGVDSVLDQFELGLLVFPDEQLIEFEVVAVAVAQGVRLDVFQEFSPVLIILKTEKMLNAVQGLVIVEI